MKMARKHPIRHSVRSHDRTNAHVHKYERGKGKAPVTPKRVIARVSPPEITKFRVVVDDTSFEVKATTFLDALDMGLEKRSASSSIRIIKGGN